MGGGKSKIPSPPPLPPPPLKNSSGDRERKLKTTKEVFKRSPPMTGLKNPGSKPMLSPQPTIQYNTTVPLSRPGPASSPPVSSNRVTDEQSEVKVPVPPSLSPSSRKKNMESVVEIVRNDVSFYNEEECSDPDDEFAFTCCIQPNSPRFPPNPRPFRDWDPAFLPSSTNVQTSLGRNCKRCGKPVYLAELYLSSRGPYHTECYKCCLCGKSLDSFSVAEFKGEIFCKGCYRRNFGTHGCGFGVGAGVLQTP